jgi:mannose-6-phosphate isomerase
MEMDQSEVNERLQPLLDRIIPAYKNNQLYKNQEDFWAARAALTYNQAGKTDRGIFSIYIFNLVRLHAGETLFQDAGLPHAYLEGQNVEIMANSDNVLRGGLTPKHVDVGELLKHIHFEPTIPNIIRETSIEKNVVAFKTPAPDFELGKIELAKDGLVSLHSRSTELFIVLKGEIEITENGENVFRCKTGDAWVSFDQANYGIHALNDALVFRASVPFKA